MLIVFFKFQKSVNNFFKDKIHMFLPKNISIRGLKNENKETGLKINAGLLLG